MKFFSCRYSRHQRFDRVSFGANFQTGKTTKRNSPSGSSSPVSSYGRLLLNSTWGNKGWKITFTLTNSNFNWMVTVFCLFHFFYVPRGPVHLYLHISLYEGLILPTQQPQWPRNVSDFSFSSYIRLGSGSAVHSQSLSTIHPQNPIRSKC
jgi:hypothetical protein